MTLRAIFRHPVALPILAIVLTIGYVVWRGELAIRSEDRRAWLYFENGDYETAATAFASRQWRAAAYFKAGDFEQAANFWSMGASAEDRFNAGNAVLMQGDYTRAVMLFEEALAIRPDWPPAMINREIAISRRDALKTKGGEMTGGKLAADDYVFTPPSDSSNSTPPEETESVAQALDDASAQEIWLRQVQTRPADFLRSKFAWQQAARSQEEGP
jgi:Ca-activated chloride channel family protein